MKAFPLGVVVSLALLEAACGASPTPSNGSQESTTSAASSAGTGTGFGTGAAVGTGTGTGSTSGTTGVVQTAGTGATTGSSPTPDGGTEAIDSGIPDAEPYASSVPRIDQVAYYQQLASHRSDLTALTTPLTGSPCYEAMMTKQAYRGEILDGSQLPDPFEAGLYTSAEKTADLTWIGAQQAAEVAFCEQNPGGGCSALCPSSASSTCAACPTTPLGVSGASLNSVYASGYGLCDFVGYKEGPNIKIYDSNGLVWLVYFELSHVDVDLTVSAFQAFTQQLAAYGFEGDTKILTDPALPQQARFQYNDVIVHGHSMYDGELAEALGLLAFGPYLSGVGRGLDVGDGGEWSSYLCSQGGDLSAVPADAVAYTNYAE